MKFRKKLKEFTKIKKDRNLPKTGKISTNRRGDLQFLVESLFLGGAFDQIIQENVYIRNGCLELCMEG